MGSLDKGCRPLPPMHFPDAEMYLTQMQAHVAAEFDVRSLQISWQIARHWQWREAPSSPGYTCVWIYSMWHQNQWRGATHVLPTRHTQSISTC